MGTVSWTLAADDHRD